MLDYVCPVSHLLEKLELGLEMMHGPKSPVRKSNSFLQMVSVYMKVFFQSQGPVPLQRLNEQSQNICAYDIYISWWSYMENLISLY